MKWVSEVRGKRWRSDDGAYTIWKLHMTQGRTGYMTAHHPVSDLDPRDRRLNGDSIGIRWTLDEAQQLATRDERERQ